MPLAAHAQQSDVRRIGVLMPAAADDPELQARIGAFLQGCSNWAGPTAATCGSTTRWAAGDADRHSQIRGGIGRARAGRHPGHGSLTVGPLLQATRTVPIVFAIVPDPVGAGFVESLARPGGNATGFMHVRIQLEREMAGAAQRDRARRDAGGGASGCRHNRRDRPVRRNPVRGAVARGGGEPDQRARRRARSSAPSRHSRAPRMAA